MKQERYVSSIYYSGSYSDTKLSFMKEHGIVRTLGEKILNPEYEKVKLENVKRDVAIFQNGVHPNRQSTFIEISQIWPTATEWNQYPRLSPENFYNLKTSIYNYGVIHSILVVEMKPNHYVVISGLERLEAVKELYTETNDESFRTIPVMIMKKHEVNDWIIRDIMIDCNLSRTRNAYTTMKIVITKHAIKNHEKKRRNEVNICREISSEINVSEATVYNYLMLENLVPDVLELLECGQINLASARKLAGFSTEYQQTLLDKVGKYEIRNYMIKMIRKNSTFAQIDSHIINFKNNIVPPMADISVHASRKDILEIKKLIDNYIKTNFLRNAKAKTKNLSYNFSCGHPHLNTNIVDIPKFLEGKVVIEEKKKYVRENHKIE